MDASMIESGKQFIQNFNGRKLELDDRSTYEKWALEFFHNKEFVSNPLLNISLQIDITEAYQHYNEKYKNIESASFTAYLMWNIVKCASFHPTFRYRKINGEWYIFDRLPLFAPIALGGDVRFRDMLLDPPIDQTLEDFFEYYRKVLEDIKADLNGELKIVDFHIWCNSWFVGNLPNIQFTGMKLHQSINENGRPFFYFGKRYKQADRLYIPLLIDFDHSNLDPFVISNFLEDFQKLIEGKELNK